MVLPSDVMVPTRGDVVMAERWPAPAKRVVLPTVVVTFAPPVVTVDKMAEVVMAEELPEAEAEPELLPVGVTPGVYSVPLALTADVADRGVGDADAQYEAT